MSDKKKGMHMKDRFEAKLMLIILPALVLWEIVYQLLIVKMAGAEQNDTIHGIGFVILVGVAWFIYKKKLQNEEEENQDA